MARFKAALLQQAPDQVPKHAGKFYRGAGYERGSEASQSTASLSDAPLLSKHSLPDATAAREVARLAAKAADSPARAGVVANRVTSSFNANVSIF